MEAIDGPARRIRTETTAAAALIGVVDGTTILLLFVVLLRSLWHCRSSSLLAEMMHSKLLVGCRVGGGEAKANDENGRGCGLGLFRPMFHVPLREK